MVDDALWSSLQGLSSPAANIYEIVPELRGRGASGTACPLLSCVLVEFCYIPRLPSSKCWFGLVFVVAGVPFWQGFVIDIPLCVHSNTVPLTLLPLPMTSPLYLL